MDALGNSNIQIAIAAHKPYWVPSDFLYVPVHAGAEIAVEPISGFASDAQGDSVSALNPFYSELTVLYWAWKNLQADYVGLVHYRRHFAGTGERGVLAVHEAQDLLKQAPVVVPKRRNYIVESIGSHYAHTHCQGHLDLLQEAVAQCAPDCANALERQLARRSAHMFNMVIMRADVLDEYCSWLFPILVCVDNALQAQGFYQDLFSGVDSVEKGRQSVDSAQSSLYNLRAVGRLGELLLDVWLEHAGVPYVEREMRNLEFVNWGKKGMAFLQAKFLGKKYQRSF